MKIRTKLILSMSVLIVFIMLFLLAATHVQFYISRDLSYLEDKGVFEALREEFEHYYADNGHSWADVSAAKFEHAGAFAEIALVIDGKPLYRLGSLSVDELRNDGYLLALYEGKQKVGRLYVMNDRQYKTYEFKTMWYRILPNIAAASLLFTCIAALLTIVLLSWRLTSPIRKIIKGIEAVKQGYTSASFPVQRKDEFGAIARAIQEMNHSLAGAERTRKQFLSDVAHELKTPLMIIQGEIELAQETEAGMTPAKQASILDEVLRLSRLVHEVLELSKLEAGMTELRPQVVELAAMLEELEDKTRFLAEEKQIRTSMRIPEDSIQVMAEKNRILQALYNIWANAIHYTDQGGAVELRLDRVYRSDQKREYARIRIEDNGIGISEKALPHIFNRFYRADHSRTRPSGGTGLGLAIAQQNILAHRGWIEVQSEAGKGTVFTIFLPVNLE
ncbi:sensor histidine kinase [Paenibacillus arenilitoris]|uniref:histidine kinase n=1 Tax=Paenibacillus arenilitoris TaxID=2772299 RepID=A0A927CQI0_9BACL|nr:HAMP domain-containing sensor histidine kinase [Paenibacillus arenilitoris]MBD2870953.1 HAMP domain-containing histidine kinase [Paenibacillus arenilitoris]